MKSGETNQLHPMSRSVRKISFVTILPSYFTRRKTFATLFSWIKSISTQKLLLLLLSTGLLQDWSKKSIISQLQMKVLNRVLTKTTLTSYIYTLNHNGYRTGSSKTWLSIDARRTPAWARRLWTIANLDW